MVQRGRVIDRAMVNCQKMTSDRVFIVAQSRRVARLVKDPVDIQINSIFLAEELFKEISFCKLCSCLLVLSLELGSA